MKRSIIVLTALLCMGAPAAAVAGDNTTELLQRVEQLTQQNDRLSDQLDHKSDVLACERAKGRALERALRTGAPVGYPARCS